MTLFVIVGKFLLYFRLATNLRGGAYRIKVLKVYPVPETKEAQVKILEEGKALIREQLAQWRK